VIICKPLSDEYARGHVGRFKLLNHIPSLLETSSGIRREVATRGLRPENDSLAAKVACLVDMPLKEYLRCHTLMAIHSPTADFPLLNGKKFWSSNAVALLGMANLRSNAFFCKRCVQDDMASFGYCYWRRSHQIPGVHWCEKHANYSLTQVDAQLAFLKLPSFWIAHDSSLSASSNSSYLSSNGIRHLIALQGALANKGEVFDRALVKASLQYQANLIGIRTNQQGRFQLLSDLALEHLSVEFLADYFQEPYNHENKRQLCSKIDDVLKPSLQEMPSKATILAASLLYNSVGQAFDNWRFRSKGTPRTAHLQ
jgi:hypothetical protein